MGSPIVFRPQGPAYEYPDLVPRLMAEIQRILAQKEEQKRYEAETERRGRLDARGAGRPARPEADAVERADPEEEGSPPEAEGQVLHGDVRRVEQAVDPGSQDQNAVHREQHADKEPDRDGMLRFLAHRLCHPTRR